MSKAKKQRKNLKLKRNKKGYLLLAVIISLTLVWMITPKPDLQVCAGKKVLFIIPCAGFVDQEVLDVYSGFASEGANISFASTTTSEICEGLVGLKIKPNVLLDEITENYDAYILPGGLSALSLSTNNNLKQVINLADKNNKIIIATSTSPALLAMLGVLNDRIVTVYPYTGLVNLTSIILENKGLIINYEIYIDENIITVKNPENTQGLNDLLIYKVCGGFFGIR